MQEEDKATLSKLPGVGGKTAERLIMDMRDKIEGHDVALTVVSVSGGGMDDSRREAFSALTSLGYKPAEARKMLDNVQDDVVGTEDILRQVLQSAAPAGGA